MAVILCSSEPVKLESIFLDMMHAVFESCYHASIHRYAPFGHSFEYKNELLGLQLTFWDNEHMDKNLIFYLMNYEGQIYDYDQGGLTNLTDTKNNIIAKPKLYRLATSENFNSEIAFYFSYYYLKRNREHLISLHDMLVDWEFMKKAFENGFTSEGWYLRKKT